MGERGLNLALLTKREGEGNASDPDPALWLSGATYRWPVGGGQWPATTGRVEEEREWRERGGE